MTASGDIGSAEVIADPTLRRLALAIAIAILIAVATLVMTAATIADPPADHPTAQTNGEP